jgi:hypothetical protein
MYKNMTKKFNLFENTPLQYKALNTFKKDMKQWWNKQLAWSQ